ncbi:MAG: hypothetical protein AAF587_38475 [Bacteroidota bacterium]
MKRKLQHLIPKAIETIKLVGIPKTKGSITSVSGTYHGFIASFGAGIVQAGVLPAVIFFENSERDGADGADKYRITQALYCLMKWEKEKKPVGKQPDQHALSAYIISNNLQDNSRFLDQLTTYAVALKIAMRTFKKP